MIDRLLSFYDRRDKREEKRRVVYPRRPRSMDFPRGVNLITAMANLLADRNASVYFPMPMSMSMFDEMD